MDVTKYVEYLDKEMTIMGILSAVSVAAPAAILNALLGEDRNGFKERILSAGPFFAIGGSVFCIIAGLLFYRERSLLAWYYGQIRLTEAMNGSSEIQEQLEAYLRNVDSWAEWKSYSWGFDALVVGFVEYIAATLCVLSRPGGGLFWVSRTVGFAFPILTGAFAVIQWHVYNRYRFSDDMWGDFLSRLRGVTGVDHAE